MSAPRSDGAGTSGGTWRLLLDGDAPGAVNMARDRALLTSVAEGDSPPTLRLYGWDVPTVTLGRFQRVGDVDLAEVAARGFGLARRPTGGRGVLHADEVTYAFVARAGDGVPRGTAASYAHLCEPLAEALRLLGIDAELTRRDGGSGRTGACYLHATRADLSVGGAKLSGSAQVWHRDAVLQHGSLVISRDAVAEAAVFRLGPAGADELERSTATIGALIDPPPSREAVRAALAEAVRALWGVDLREGRATAHEEAEALVRVPEHAIET